MTSRTIQVGQTEIGIVEHEGREFAAMGANVCGRSITGYHKLTNRGDICLTSWDGKRTMLACRCTVVKTYDVWEWGKTHALRFDLTNGRTIVGYSLGNGFLFRGTLLDASKRDDADYLAKQEAEHWMDRDQEDADSDFEDDEDCKD